MNRIRRRDPETGAWPSLRSPRPRTPSYREKLEAQARAARKDEEPIIVESHDPGEPRSWFVTLALAFWIIVAFGIARCVSS